MKKLLTQEWSRIALKGPTNGKLCRRVSVTGVDPDEMIAAFGADAARLFVLFASRLKTSCAGQKAASKARQFLRRVYNNGVALA